MHRLTSIRAAGGIIRRFVAGGRVEVACIYREARGDWTFPKGKIDEGETFEQGALREVFEETGMSCHGHPIRRHDELHAPQGQAEDRRLLLHGGQRR